MDATQTDSLKNFSTEYACVLGLYNSLQYRLGVRWWNEWTAWLLRSKPLADADRDEAQGLMTRIYECMDAHLDLENTQEYKKAVGLGEKLFGMLMDNLPKK